MNKRDIIFIIVIGIILFGTNHFSYENGIDSIDTSHYRWEKIAWSLGGFDFDVWDFTGQLVHNRSFFGDVDYNDRWILLDNGTLLRNDPNYPGIVRRLGHYDSDSFLFSIGEDLYICYKFKK